MLSEANKANMVPSMAVQQYQLPPYELIKGLFADYQELNMQFAYRHVGIVQIDSFRYDTTKHTYEASPTTVGSDT